MRAAGFEGVSITVKEQSRAYIKEWVPGSGAEDHVVSADITATKPTDVSAPMAPAGRTEPQVVEPAADG